MKLSAASAALLVLVMVCACAPQKEVANSKPAPERANPIEPAEEEARAGTSSTPLERAFVFAQKGAAACAENMPDTVKTRSALSRAGLRNDAGRTDSTFDAHVALGYRVAVFTSKTLRPSGEPYFCELGGALLLRNCREKTIV